MKINVFSSEKELQKARDVNLLPALIFLTCVLILRILGIMGFWVGLLVVLIFFSLAMYLFFPFYTNAQMEFTNKNEILFSYKKGKRLIRLDEIEVFSFESDTLGIRSTILGQDGSIFEFFICQYLHNRPFFLYNRLLQEIGTRNALLSNKIKIIPLDTGK
jgi:hypothetical protein